MGSQRRGSWWETGTKVSTIYSTARITPHTHFTGRYCGDPHLEMRSEVTHTGRKLDWNSNLGLSVASRNQHIV